MFFSLVFLSLPYFFQLCTKQHAIYINVSRCSYRVSVVFVRFQPKLILVNGFGKNLTNNFTKISLVGAEFLHLDRLMDSRV